MKVSCSLEALELWARWSTFWSESTILYCNNSIVLTENIIVIYVNSKGRAAVNIHLSASSLENRFVPHQNQFSIYTETEELTKWFKIFPYFNPSWGEGAHG